MDKPTALTICRVGYCEWCAKENRPHTGQMFVAIGSAWHYHVYEAQRIAPRYGFTPYLYRVHKVIGENVVVDYVCSMNECGSTILWNDDRQRWWFTIPGENWGRTILSLSDWNSLVTYKRDLDYFI